jgi:hypothetical protein
VLSASGGVAASSKYQVMTLANGQVFGFGGSIVSQITPGTFRVTTCSSLSNHDAAYIREQGNTCI